MSVPVTALLLSAGKSRRMGRPKALLPLGGEPLIRHIVKALHRGGIDDALVVTGPDETDIREALSGLDVRLVANPLPEADMADSVRAGLTALRPATGAVLLCLVDHPLVRFETVAALIEAHRKEPGTIVIPTFENRQGHPTLFPRTVLEEIRDQPTLREVVRSDEGRIRRLSVSDPGVRFDMDTPDLYQEACRLWREAPASP